MVEPLRGWFGYLTNRLRSEQEAKEVAQEAYLQLLQLQNLSTPRPSIFDLMASGCNAEKVEPITAGDMAYLRALYKIYPDRVLGMQQSAIENIMMSEFEKP